MFTGFDAAMSDTGASRPTSTYEMTVKLAPE